MKIERAVKEDIVNIVEMSIRAFSTDINVGGIEGDYPPDYDSINWHTKMAEEGHLYKAVVDGKIIGATILFVDEKNECLYVGRIFIDNIYHKKGYGIKLMECIEKHFSFVKQIKLDTPVWNVRTNSFYQKVGYTITKQKDDFVYYQKELGK